MDIDSRVKSIFHRAFHRASWCITGMIWTSSDKNRTQFVKRGQHRQPKFCCFAPLKNRTGMCTTIRNILWKFNCTFLLNNKCRPFYCSVLLIVRLTIFPRLRFSHHPSRLFARTQDLVRPAPPSHFNVSSILYSNFTSLFPLHHEKKTNVH